MIKGPGLFSEIGKKAKDLLTRDYSYDQKFTVSTYSGDVGVGLISTAVKKGGLSTGDIAVQYKYKNHIIDVKVDTESNISSTLIFSEIVPSTKTIVTFKLPDYNSGKLEVQYFHEHATITSAVARKNQSPTLDLTGTIGNSTFAIGGETSYDTSSGNFTKYTAAIGVTNAESSASIILADKGDMLTASYVHHVDHLKSAGVAEISRRFSTNENTFTVGASYAIDPMTVMKMRLNNYGKLGALLQHELKPKSTLTISGEFDTKALDKNPRFGLALALKP
ncbi:hypothetical protein MRB53_018032 [Persea americana]|uniref:Uncharacterized protein n=1 Tax=Persea americana TaxID=3435 RepID=A0ACC2M7B2_PERAE|nr:hypothetical protein MRB53_018032 [Persea americana]|eukprot:TRINITY_DN2322_c1_g1_i1.p1 TRINITY_DN2322_c1_g1~~TRINITY_DN2322_c1_g1_i1.p1  ORF type:complete len:278 (+),score=57.48 TRINITY_DN2322_c1_g1_i1:85-918(+)